MLSEAAPKIETPSRGRNKRLVKLIPRITLTGQTPAQTPHRVQTPVWIVFLKRAQKSDMMCTHQF